MKELLAFWRELVYNAQMYWIYGFFDGEDDQFVSKYHIAIIENEYKKYSYLEITVNKTLVNWFWDKKEIYFYFKENGVVAYDLVVELTKYECYYLTSLYEYILGNEKE